VSSADDGFRRPVGRDGTAYRRGSGRRDQSWTARNAGAAGWVRALYKLSPTGSTLAVSTEQGSANASSAVERCVPRDAVAIFDLQSCGPERRALPGPLGAHVVRRNFPCAGRSVGPAPNGTCASVGPDERSAFATHSRAYGGAV
jgi:hypothetical protein